MTAGSSSASSTSLGSAFCCWTETTNQLLLPHRADERASNPNSNSESGFTVTKHRIGSHLWVVQALPKGEAGTVVTLRVDVSQNRYKEGGRLPLRNQLPTAGLTELERGWQGERRKSDEDRGQKVIGLNQGRWKRKRQKGSWKAAYQTTVGHMFSAAVHLSDSSRAGPSLTPQNRLWKLSVSFNNATTSTRVCE